MNKFTENTIYSFKLHTGDEIVAKVIKNSPTEGTVSIEKPLVVVMTPQGIEMIPWMVTADEIREYPLKYTDYIIYRDTNAAAINAYNARTSAIQQPEAKTILTG